MMQAGNLRSKKRSRRGSVSEINVTPLVDVMLVLLIVFMITSPLLVAGVKIDLPETNLAPISIEDEPLSITIDKDHNLFIQNTKIEPSQLVSKLIAITKQNMETRIFVRGDKDVSYGKIMEIMGLINQAGFNKIALLTESKNE